MKSLMLLKNLLKKKNISQTAKVKVSINPKGGENKTGLVERIEVIEDSTSTEEAPKEETPIDSDTKGYEKEFTVGGVSLDKRNIIFKEEDDIWYDLHESIDAQVVKDTMTHQTVKVSITVVEGAKNIVDRIELSGEPKSTGSDKGNSENRTENSSIQKSIEAQVAVEHANLIVSKTIDKDTEPETIKTRITNIATHNYQTIQNLKKK